MALMEAYVVIKASLEPLKRGLSLARAAVSKAMASIQAAINKMVSVGKKAFLGLAAAMGVASYAAMKQEKAEFMLAAALKVTGEYTDKAFQKFKRFASAVQKTTTYGDEDVLMLMALMKNLGVVSGKLEEATKQAIGLAAATNRDVKSMAMYIALAQQGEFTMLRRYIPALRSTTDATEQLRIIQEFSARGFKIAQAETFTTIGALKQMKNAVGDVIEVIGKPFLDNITKTAKKIKDWAVAHQDAIGRVAASFDRLIEVAIRIVTEFTKPLIKALSGLASKFSNFASEARLTDSMYAVAEWADKIWIRIKALWDLVVNLWKSDEFGNAVKYGLGRALAEFERWGKQLLLIFGKIWQEIENRAVVSAKRIAAKTYEQSMQYHAYLQSIGREKGGRTLFGIPFVTGEEKQRAREKAAKRVGEMEEAGVFERMYPTAPTKPWKDVWKEMLAVPLRDVPLPKEVKKSFDAFKDVIDKEDVLIKDKWRQVKEEMSMTSKQAEAVKALAGAAAPGAAALPGKVPTKAGMGFAGLADMWKGFVMSLNQPQKRQEGLLRDIKKNTRETTDAVKDIEVNMTYGR